LPEIPLSKCCFGFLAVRTLRLRLVRPRKGLFGKEFGFNGPSWTHPESRARRNRPPPPQKLTALGRKSSNLYTISSLKLAPGPQRNLFATIAFPENCSGPLDGRKDGFARPRIQVFQPCRAPTTSVTEAQRGPAMSSPPTKSFLLASLHKRSLSPLLRGPYNRPARLQLLATWYDPSGKKEGISRCKRERIAEFGNEGLLQSASRKHRTFL